MTAAHRTEPSGRTALLCDLRSRHSSAVHVLLLAILMFAMRGSAAGDWAVAAADARVPLCVEGDLYARENAKCEMTVDFNKVLAGRRALAAESLSLLDAATGQAVALEVAQDAEIRCGSGNPILRLRWSFGPLARFERGSWHLYFRTVAAGSEGAWVPLDATFVPKPANVLLDTSFEAADPKRPDRPALMNPGGRDVKGETTDRVWTDEVAHSGKRSLKIARKFEDGPPRNTNRPFWRTWPPPMPVQPGQGVRLSAWIKCPRLETGAVALAMLMFCDASGRRIREGRLMLRGQRIPHDWVRVDSSTIAPAGAASAIFWFSLHREGEAYCDDVKVTAVPGGVMPRLQVVAGPIESRAAFAVGKDERPEGKVLACGIAQTPPAIDGALDDPCWKTAGRVEDFEVHVRIPGTQVATTVLACADRDALYFGFECSEPSTANLKASATTRDGRLWEDDSVELFLDTNLDLHTYYQIIVNSRGVFFDQDTGTPGLAGPKWDGPVTAAGRVGPDRWTAEVKIEFTGLRLAEAEGRSWGANFARSSFRGGRSLYVWSPIRKNFGEPQHFGRVVLPFDPTANVVTGKPLAEGRVFWGRGALRFEVANQRREPVAVRVTAAEEAAAGDRRLAAATGTVSARAASELLIPAAFPTPGEVRVRYEIVEVSSGKRLYRTSVAHAVPEPLTIAPATLVSYLGEGRLQGTWALGLAEDALAGARLALAVFPMGAGKPIATRDIAPKATTGTYALSVPGLATGRYELSVRLLHGGKTLDESRCRFDRIVGPFSARP